MGSYFEVVMFTGSDPSVFFRYFNVVIFFNGFVFKVVMFTGSDPKGIGGSDP